MVRRLFLVGLTHGYRLRLFAFHFMRAASLPSHSSIVNITVMFDSRILCKNAQQYSHTKHRFVLRVLAPRAELCCAAMCSALAYHNGVGSGDQALSGPPHRTVASSASEAEAARD